MMASDPTCGDAKCVICSTGDFVCEAAIERRFNAKATRVQRPFDGVVPTMRRCREKDAHTECSLARMASCTKCPTDFPALSLMKGYPHAYPAPNGAPKPRIRLIGGIGNRTYVCASLHGPADQQHQHVGFGSTARFAWNAWVSRLESILARNGTL